MSRSPRRPSNGSARGARHLRPRLAAAALAVALGALAVAPSGAGAATLKGFWGPLTVNGQSQFPVYRDLGVDLYQMNLSWALVAPTRPANPRDPADPAYKWTPEIDFALQQAQANGMEVLLLASFTPPWANGGRAPNFAPTRASDFADFLQAAARRYPTVRHWMIWGEPTRLPNFLPFRAQGSVGHALTPAQAAAPRRYARLLDAAYGALKRVRLTNLVIGGNTFTAGNIRPRRWVQNMKLRDGRPPRMDLYGHNPFSFRTPRLSNPPSAAENADMSDMGRFDRTVNEFLRRPGGKRIRLFLSELAIPTDVDSEFNFHVTRQLQARWIRNSFQIARRINAYGLGWIHLFDEPQRNDGNPVISSGLLTFDGQKKPGYFAFKSG
jgi:hypothetical protein